MDGATFAALRAEASTICTRWEALLRVEPGTTALGNPDTLAFLIPSTVEAIFAALAKPRFRGLTLGAALRLPRAACTSQANPYLSFFKAGEQALLETLVLTQAKLGTCATRDTELAEFYATYRAMSKRDIEAFCGICAHRAHEFNCRRGKRSRAEAALLTTGTTRHLTCTD